MTPSEAATVLTVASGVDNRTVTPEAATVWSGALRADMSVKEACSAIATHFANSTDYLMPAHINAIVTGWRRERAKILPSVVPPRELSKQPKREVEWQRVWGDAFIAGHSEESARRIANRDFGITEEEPLALEQRPLGSLTAALDRAERDRIAKKRLAEIKVEVEK